MLDQRKQNITKQNIFNAYLYKKKKTFLASAASVIYFILFSSFFFFSLFVVLALLSRNDVTWLVSLVSYRTNVYFEQNETHVFGRLILFYSHVQRWSDPKLVFFSSAFLAFFHLFLISFFFFGA